ncbi:hypothetical protein OH77DRAFT_1594285 [Trametes cingulata]|nr:hypothetical protein OH77DRAFT_1594285 [Trametes cingulata]
MSDASGVLPRSLLRARCSGSALPNYALVKPRLKRLATRNREDDYEVLRHTVLSKLAHPPCLASPPQDLQTLSRPARVCDTLKDPPLRLLWASLPALFPLRSLLAPSKVVGEHPGELETITTNSTPRPTLSEEPPPQNWACVLESSARVREVRYDELGVTRVDRSDSVFLARFLPGHPSARSSRARGTCTPLAVLVLPLDADPDDALAPPELPLQRAPRRLCPNSVCEGRHDSTRSSRSPPGAGRARVARPAEGKPSTGRPRGRSTWDREQRRGGTVCREEARVL